MAGLVAPNGGATCPAFQSQVLSGQLKLFIFFVHYIKGLPPVNEHAHWEFSLPMGSEDI